MRDGRSLKALLLGAALAIATPLAASAAPAPVFDAQAAPRAPNYADPAAWAAFGSLPGASDVIPAGATPKAKAAPVDVFYVHPTTLLSKDQFNQDLADAKTNAWTDGSVVARQAGIFNACCRIFAPRYRQSSNLAQASKVDGTKASELAYGDVERAFDYYLAHENHGRPFILAGHSQGGLQISRLLARRIDGSPTLRKQLVVAYVIGMNLAQGDFSGVYTHTPVCATPSQLHCAVQWNAVLDTVDLDKLGPVAEAGYVALHGDGPGKTTLCVNPLTFDRSKPAATASHSLGAVPGAPDASPLQPLRAGAVSAQCQHGFLVVKPDPALGLTPLPGGSLHYHDLGLFYADVRANAALRVKTFLGAAKR